jgi:hypothetical protein
MCSSRRLAAAIDPGVEPPAGERGPAAARLAVDDQVRPARCLGPGGATGVGGFGPCAVLAVACQAAPSSQLGQHGFAEELVVFGHARSLCPHL